MFRIAVVQMNSSDNSQRNLATAERLIRSGAADGARMACLPESFNWLGPDRDKPANSEPVPGPTSEKMGALARELGLWIHCGSILEQQGHGKCFNTSLLIDPDGAICATYRKIHLFDADVGDTAYRESEFVEAGNATVTADVDSTTCGFSICYDLRFPELYRALASAGAELIFAPAAFTIPTGEAHWTTLVRARAIENQAFMVAPGQVGTDPSGKVYYGHSMAVDPWGLVLLEMDGTTAGVATVDIDPALPAEVRGKLPALKHRRLDG